MIKEFLRMNHFDFYLILSKENTLCVFMSSFLLCGNTYFCYLSICLPRSLLISFWPGYNKDSHHLTPITLESIFSQPVLFLLLLLPLAFSSYF